MALWMGQMFGNGVGGAVVSDVQMSPPAPELGQWVSVSAWSDAPLLRKQISSVQLAHVLIYKTDVCQND